MRELISWDRIKASTRIIKSIQFSQNRNSILNSEIKSKCSQNKFQKGNLDGGKNNLIYTNL